MFPEWIGGKGESPVRPVHLSKEIAIHQTNWGFALFIPQTVLRRGKKRFCIDLDIFVYGVMGIFWRANSHNPLTGCG